MTVLVDSDILIEVSRGRNVDVVSKWIDLSNSDAAVLYSPVSVAELWAGARPNEYRNSEQSFPGADMYSDRRRSGSSGGRLPAAVQTKPRNRDRGCFDCRGRGSEQSRAVDAKPQALPHEGSLLLGLKLSDYSLRLLSAYMLCDLHALSARGREEQYVSSRQRRAAMNPLPGADFHAHCAFMINGARFAGMQVQP